MVLAGPGSGLSEELVWGCEPAAAVNPRMVLRINFPLFVTRG